jgi:hypothetical protein
MQPKEWTKQYKELKADYEVSDLTLEQMAHKYRVTINQIYHWARNNNWVRNKAQSDIDDLTIGTCRLAAEYIDKVQNYNQYEQPIVSKRFKKIKKAANILGNNICIAIKSHDQILLQISKALRDEQICLDDASKIIANLGYNMTNCMKALGLQGLGITETEDQEHEEADWIIGVETETISK